MKNALILSGGGARAAYQVGVLKAVAEILPEDSRNPFKIICGTSAGALNAVSLAAFEGSFKDAVEDLEGLWRSLEPGDIYRYGWWEMMREVSRLVMSLFNRGVGVTRPIALLDNTPLELLIKRKIKFHQIDRAIARGDVDAVSVTALGYSTGRSVCFFQGKQDLDSWERHRRIGRRTLLNADHLLASSAIPALFPTTRIEHEYFGDGSLRQVSPISPALHLGAEQVFIVGVSGNRDHQPRKLRATRHSPSMAQIIGQMFNSAFIDSLEGDIEELDRINKLVALIPEEQREEHNVEERVIKSLVVSPSAHLDKIAGQKIRYLPASLRFSLRTMGATASTGGATAASYLLFSQPFIKELIELGYQDAMSDRQAIEDFFQNHEHQL